MVYDDELNRMEACSFFKEEEDYCDDCDAEETHEMPPDLVQLISKIKNGDAFMMDDLCVFEDLVSVTAIIRAILLSRKSLRCDSVKRLVKSLLNVGLVYPEIGAVVAETVCKISLDSKDVVEKEVSNFCFDAIENDSMHPLALLLGDLLAPGDLAVLSASSTIQDISDYLKPDLYNEDIIERIMIDGTLQHKMKALKSAKAPMGIAYECFASEDPKAASEGLSFLLHQMEVDVNQIAPVIFRWFFEFPIAQKYDALAFFSKHFDRLGNRAYFLKNGLLDYANVILSSINVRFQARVIEQTLTLIEKALRFDPNLFIQVLPPDLLGSIEDFLDSIPPFLREKAKSIFEEVGNACQKS